jgi:hypothetical protein
LRTHQPKCKEEGRNKERQIDVGSMKEGRIRKGSELKKHKIKSGKQTTANKGGNVGNCNFAASYCDVYTSLAILT